MSEGARTLVLTVPDWPALAVTLREDINVSEPVMVVRAGVVYSANASARKHGVARGMNTRSAQLRCPHAHVYPFDLDRDHQEFATAVTVLDHMVARFSLFHPGTVTIPISSLERTYENEERAVHDLLTELIDATGWEVFAGIADTPFAALLAADSQTRVELGRTGKFLAPLSVDRLRLVDSQFTPLTVLLHRLGIDRLGQLATLPRTQVYTRFGETGARAWLLASGHTYELPREHVRSRDFTVSAPVEPPTGRLDIISFKARELAIDFVERIREAGLVCTHVRIVLHASNDTYERTWHLDTLTETTLADRVRWQAAGWQGSRTEKTPHAEDSGGSDANEDGIHHIEFFAQELVAPLRAQSNLFAPHTDDVSAALERIQGLFGIDAVNVPALQGGRSPEETNLWTPWRHSTEPTRDPRAPWPGALPPPRPTLVENTPVDLLNEYGEPVVARPAGLDSAPRVLRTREGTQAVTNFSSAWPVDTQWWDKYQYHVRCQVVTETGEAYVLCKEAGQWAIVGRYA
ncbi:DNA polymerase Y family protein [Brevibacterium paucivorans]|uniref:DNA polymerase Y family protein n=1 Tax=Brevibacterium paucivorans TaxID=170994 RepID=UPI0031D3FAA9